MESTPDIARSGGIQASIPTRHNVYMIRSSWALSEIREYLVGVGLEHNIKDAVYKLKIEYTREGRQTDRTIAVIAPKLGDILCTMPLKRGHPIVNKWKLPPPATGGGRGLHIPVPKTLKVSGTKLRTWTNDALTSVVSLGILKSTDYEIAVPLSNREFNTPGNNVFVSFHKDVDDDTIATTRVLIHDTYWGDTENIFQCYFRRSKKVTRKGE